MSQSTFKPPIEIINKKAEYAHFLVDYYVAGLKLTGTEIKSIRQGHANLNDSYCYFHRGELYVKSMYIKEYKFGNINNHEPRRERKLLLKKQELKKLHRRVQEKGMTIIPYRLFINERGFAKLEIALSKGKKSHDKRHSIKDKDMKRDMNRAAKDRF